MASERLRRVVGIVVVVALGLAVAAPALAEPSAADRETARSLVVEGRKKLDQGDAEGAAKAFRGAHDIMGVPTTGLDLAKALTTLGKLVEARDLALQVSRTEPRPGEAPAFAKARKTAAELAEQLAPRLAALQVNVKGPPPNAVEVTLDGELLNASALGLSRKVNPGEHTVAARAPGFRPGEAKVVVGEGESKPVELTLELAPVEKPPPPPPPAPPPPPPRTPAWVWAAGAVGVVAGGVGAGFFVDHLSVQDRIGRDCPRGVCDPTKYNRAEVQELQAHREMSGAIAIGLFAAGGAGLVTFAVGLALPRDEARKPSPAGWQPRDVRLGAAPNGVVLRGSLF